MDSTQHTWTPETGWQGTALPDTSDSNTVIFVFGDRLLLQETDCIPSLRTLYPAGHIIGCSTSGEIFGGSVLAPGILAVAARFDHTTVKSVAGTLGNRTESHDLGERLARELNATPELKHVVVLAEGVHLSGGDLVGGFLSGLPDHVSMTGGMAGDDDRIEQSVTLHNTSLSSHQVVAVGLYGSRLKVSSGSMGGWGPFGPDRMITRAEGNYLHTLDNEPALELYKRYLGERARNLPADAMFFPLSIQRKGHERSVVRTVVGMDEETGSLILTGDVTEGSYARLMKTNVDRLLDGAEGAVDLALSFMDGTVPELALLISCYGRRFVMRQRVEEEPEVVQRKLDPRTTSFGFYSYGEFAPLQHGERCEFLNQTMTITMFSES